MSLLGHPSEWDEPDGSRPAEPYVPHKRTRGAAPCLGRGAMACPTCDVPMVVGGPVAMATTLRCPWCRRTGPARTFLRLGRSDTPFNGVQVTARLRV